MIYDESNEKVEIPQSEWISLCKTNLVNQETLRQKDIRKRLRSLNDKVIEYDEYYYEQKKGEEETNLLLVSRKKRNKNNKSNLAKDQMKNLNKAKDSSLKYLSFGVLGEKKGKLIKGKLKIETILTDKKFFHGFNISMDIIDEKDPNIIKENMKFNSKEISINSRNFKFTNLNIILQMNKQLIYEDDIEQFEKEKIKNRDNILLKRYIDEIILSSHFADIVYDNCEVSLLEILKYFVYFERRKV
jgi:hypothetical protein